MRPYLKYHDTAALMRIAGLPAIPAFYIVVNLVNSYHKISLIHTHNVRTSAVYTVQHLTTLPLNLCYRANIQAAI